MVALRQMEATFVDAAIIVEMTMFLSMANFGPPNEGL